MGFCSFSHSWLARGPLPNFPMHVRPFVLQSSSPLSRRSVSRSKSNAAVTERVIDASGSPGMFGIGIIGRAARSSFLEWSKSGRECFDVRAAADVARSLHLRLLAAPYPRRAVDGLDVRCSRFVLYRAMQIWRVSGVARVRSRRRGQSCRHPLLRLFCRRLAWSGKDKRGRRSIRLRSLSRRPTRQFQRAILA